MNPLNKLPSLFLLLLPLLFSCAPRPVESTVEPEVVVVSKPANAMEQSILSYVNKHRQTLGLAPLQLFGMATQQAYLHSKNMALGTTAFGHDGFDQRIQQIKKSFGWVTASAENVAYGQLSAREVVKGWLNSPGHKRNIEGDYRYTGIGYYRDQRGVIYFTQIFLRK